MLMFMILCFFSTGESKEFRPGRESAVQDEGQRSAPELRRDFRNEEGVEERGIILLLMARLAVEDVKQSKGAWAGVADGLEDASFVIRREAIRLLRMAPDREVAVKALTEALDLALAQSVSLGGGRGGGRRGGGSGGAAGRRAERGEEGEEGSGRADSRQAIQQRVGFVEDLLDALGSLPDDRSVRSLDAFFARAEGRVLGRFRLPAARAMGALKSRSLMEVLRKAFEDSHEQARREEKGRGKSNEPIEKGGEGARGRRRDRTNRVDASEVASELHQILTQASQSAELEGMPELDEDASRNWKKFLAGHRGAFPSKFGRIKPRAEEEEDRPALVRG